MSRARWRVGRTFVRSAAATLVFTAMPGSALAAWSGGGQGSASGQAEALPAPAAPSVSVAGRNVTVTWTQASYHGSLLGNQSAGGYVVSRAPAGGGSSVTPAASCSGTLTGSAASLSCTERGVPSGSWTYAVSSAFNSWRAASAASSTATVAAPSLAFTSGTAFTSLPATLSGTIAGFVDNEGLTFRLDSATSGTVLSATPSSAPVNGSATVSVTIPSGTSVGQHTVYVVGAGGSQASAAVTYAPAPTATAVAIGNGGTVQKPDANDTITLTYSQALQVSSICSTWSNDAANQSASGVTVTLTRLGGTSTQVAVTSVAGACGGTLHVGTIDNLSKNYTTTSIAYTSSTVTWTVASKQLKLTLGTPSASASAVSSSTTATYSPDSALKSTYGTAINAATKPTVSAVLF